MTAFARAPVIDSDQKRSIRGTARAFQGALSIAKAVQVNAARHDANRGRIPIGTAAAAGRLIEVFSFHPGNTGYLFDLHTCNPFWPQSWRDVSKHPRMSTSFHVRALVTRNSGVTTR